MTKLNDKVTMIAGGSSDIGAATACLFAEAGATIIITDTDDQKGQQLVEKLRNNNANAYYYHLDVTSEEDWKTVCDQVLSEQKQLDVLVNNACTRTFAYIDEMELKDWRNVTQVNLEGTFLGTKYGIRCMRRSSQGGNIVNVSSCLAFVGAINCGAYAASKAGVNLLSKTAALECAQRGLNIRINTINPSSVKTSFWQKTPWWNEFVNSVGGEEQAWEQIATYNPLGRLATPEEIAKSILFLASDDSSFVTGSALVIDGGRLAQ